MSLVSILRNETVKSVRDEMIFRVIQPDGLSAKIKSLSGFETMQIAVSHECRNDNGQNSTKKIVPLVNNENIYTELQFLLTGDLSALKRSDLM
jgi:hypothetical protein